MAHHYAETFYIKNEPYKYRKKIGFRAYNSNGDLVGIVHMTNDIRTPAYEHCEFAIFPKYQLRYGEWHRITSYGARLPWKRLIKELHEKGVYEVYVD